MYKLILFLEICLAFALGSNRPVPHKKCDKIVGCYYFPRSNLLEDIDVSLCTHLFYIYTTFGKDASVKIMDPHVDIKGAGFIKFNSLKKKNPKLKTLVSIGDMFDEDKNHTNNNVLTNPILRKTVVNNVVRFVKKYGFNGINLDLTELPQHRGRPSDKENLVLLLKALRERFDKEGFILAATVDPIGTYANIIYDIEGISTYLNFLNLKTIDFRGNSKADENVGVGHNSPMYPSLKENAVESMKNIDSVVKYWISQGAPPRKLILAIAFYGISYTLTNPKQIGRGAPFSGKGEIGGPEGIPSYCEICPLEENPQWKHFYDKEQQVPYIYNGNQIIAYDNVESIKRKAEYAEKMKLGGAMVYTMDEDDVTGVCGEKFPLLNTLNQVLRNKC